MHIILCSDFGKFVTYILGMNRYLYLFMYMNFMIKWLFYASFKIKVKKFGAFFKCHGDQQVGDFLLISLVSSITNYH